MARRTALGILFLAVLAIGAAYGSAFLPGGTPAWTPWVLAFTIPAALIAMMVVGAAGPRGVGRLVWAFALTFGILAGGFGALLLLPSTDPSNPTLWLGLPPRAALLLYGIGLLPLLIIPVAYALSFDEITLREEDLERVLVAAKAARPRCSAAGEPHLPDATLGPFVEGAPMPASDGTSADPLRPSD